MLFGHPHSLRSLLLPVFTAAVTALSPGDAAADAPLDVPGPMPYARAGLSERQAAAHLIDRFTFGATPELLDQVVDAGLENWFAQQLWADAHEWRLQAQLEGLKSLRLSNEEIFRQYPTPGRLRREAIEDGYVSLDAPADEGRLSQDQRETLRAYADAKGYRPYRELTGQLVAQKILRAAHSPNQLEEVMVDFWFNHLYVSALDNQSRPFITTYERDAIRPNVFGRFSAMLEASAKHPAMLLYLDNAQSSAAVAATTQIDMAVDDMRDRGDVDGVRGERMLARVEREQQKRQRKMEMEVEEGRRSRQGINENYARELLELHTLGVDGGYDQQDVVEVARVLTGWTVLPAGDRRERVLERLERNPSMARSLGFSIEDDFLFDPQRHDAGQKRVLGTAYGPGGGLAEGEALLNRLAVHPSTARHLAAKLARRFVGEDAPKSLVERLESSYLRTGGDLAALLWTLARSPEFWSPELRGERIKTPLELAVSAVRAIGGRVENPGQMARWIDRMGQPLYRYPAPTGFPDRAESWISAGLLVHRMNFALALAAGRIGGIAVDFTELEPAAGDGSLGQALVGLGEIVLPERPLDDTVEILLAEAESRGAGDGAWGLARGEGKRALARSDTETRLRLATGLLLGSPEFQKH